MSGNRMPKKMPALLLVAVLAFGLLPGVVWAWEPAADEEPGAQTPTVTAGEDDADLSGTGQAQAGTPSRIAGTGTNVTDSGQAQGETATQTPEIPVSVPPDESTVVTVTGNALTIYDSTGQRLVDRRETNLGDLVADAYRAVLGADIALVESGEIRAEIPAGKVTYGNILQVLPFRRELAVVRLSGADLMDALEMSASHYPNSYPGFFQVSGLTYDIQETVISSVTTDSQGNFTGVDKDYRVTNIMIGGRELDLYETYVVAGTRDMLEGDTGFAMFTNGTLGTTTVTDNVALLTYLNLQMGGQVSGVYAQPQGRMDSIRLIRQSEVDRLVDGLVAGETVDYQRQLEGLQQELGRMQEEQARTREALAVATASLKASSETGKSAGKRYVRVRWTTDEALAAVSGVTYQIYRSTSRNSGYQRMFSTENLTYKNTSGLKVGKTYYYKVRACKEIGGKTYYSPWSNIAYRLIRK